MKYNLSLKMTKCVKAEYKNTVIISLFIFLFYLSHIHRRLQKHTCNNVICKYIKKP